MKNVQLAVAVCAVMANVSFGLTLVDQDKSTCAIVVAKDATESERGAANELKRCLKQITGAEVAMVEESLAVNIPTKVFVGQSSSVRDRVADIAWDTLPPDAIVIQTVGKDLILAGGRPRGSVYAVYTFLEDVVGVRWWTSTEQDVPKRPTFTIGELNIRYQPTFRYREVYYRDAVWDKGPFAATLKLNGQNANTGPTLGGNYSILGFCHTFYQLLPPAQYFKDHPEWYSLIDGKRTHERAQLCLTNDEMRKELTRVALEWVAKNPNAGIISISQNDCEGACQCEACRAIAKEEGSESGPMLRLVNAVAADIAKKYSQMMIHTLAYTYTEAAPKYVQPATNVLVQLCSMGCYFDVPLDHPANARFRDNLLQWSKVTKNLFVWDYVANFSDSVVPYPNLQVLGANVRLFAENNVIGLFAQGDTFSMCGDMVRLRTWVLSHLVWNPSLDQQKLTDEFLRGYYGAAAPSIAEYLSLVREAFKSRGYHLSSNSKEIAYLSLVQMNQATGLWDAAERAVTTNPVLLNRVVRDRLPLDHVWLRRYAWLKRESEMTKQPFAGPKDPVAACETFITKMHKFNNDQNGGYSEGGSGAEYEASLRNQVKAAVGAKSDAVVPKECTKLPAIKWLDFQDDQMSLLTGELRIVDDAKTSNGKAVLIPGNIAGWFLRVSLTGDVARLFPKAQCMITARCEIKDKTGDPIVLSVGIYDESLQVSTMTWTVRASQFDADGYTTFNMGRWPIRGNSYFWIMTDGKVDKIPAAYVDRVFLIGQN